MQVSVRVVLPAALSGVVAALVLGASRAIGETVIILVAGGQKANLTLDPAEAMQNMAAFIAATSRADIPTSGPEYGAIFAVGHDALRDDADPQRHLDPVRAQVQAGLRMNTVAEASLSRKAVERASTGRAHARTSCSSCCCC